MPWCCEPRPDICLPEFLPYFLQSDQFHQRALEISVGSLSPTINWRTLRTQEFVLPGLDDQAEIFQVLHAAELARMRYSHIDPPSVDYRDAVTSAVWASHAQTEPLQTLADVTVGIVVKPAALYVDGGGVPALRSLNVLPNRLVEDELVYISEGAHHDRAKSQLQGGEVVVVRSGRPGDAAVVPMDGDERHAIDLLIVRCRSDIKPAYLSTYLNSREGRAQMLGRSAGTAQQHLNAGQLKQVKIPIIDLASQDVVVERAEASDRFRSQLAMAETQLLIAQQSLREGF